ncbi:PIN domain-containing protein [soil metagenome]
MNNIFLDTNVIIDFLADRKPFSEFAAAIFTLADNEAIKIYASAITFNNVYYIIRQISSHKKALALLSDLESMVDIIEVNKVIIKQALHSDFRDFEDAIQYMCALTNDKIEFIVTRNHKDFKKRQLPVFSPEIAFGILKNH